MRQSIEINNNMKDIRIVKDTDLTLIFKGGKINSSFKVIHDKANVKSSIIIKAVISNNDQFNIEPRIIVNKGSVGVETSLKIEILLLEPNIRVKAIPSMEIMENDIKAGHSLRISKINEDDIYYLTTRGLSKNESKDILINAFLTNE